MHPADLRLQTAPLFHYGSIELVSDLLTERGFAVSRFRVSRASDALLAIHSKGLRLEVWVRGRRDVTGTVVSIPAAHLEPASDRFVAIVWLPRGAALAVYLIPSRRWLDRSGSLLGLRPDPRGKGEEWTVKLRHAELEPYRFDVTIRKLLNGM